MKSSSLRPSFSSLVLTVAGLLTLPCALVACEGGEDGEDGSITPTGSCSLGRADNVEEGATMAPGLPCIGCHSRGEGPNYTIAGTVLGASHDGDVCIGVDGVTVVVTGSDGATIEIPTNSVGNFTWTGTLAKPFSAKVVGPNGENAMVATQTDGDCNSCHTEEGASSAPGRILAP